MTGRPDRPGGPPPTRVFGTRSRPELPRDPASLPELPPAYAQSLDRGLDALGLSLSPEARTAIAVHVRLLLAWNAAVNLTSITEPGAVAVGHVIDSLTALPLLAGAGSILDLGSGGGFPGLPLAAALPPARVALLESVAKKAAFLEAAVAAAGLADRASVIAARAEAIVAGSEVGPGWDAVVVRAVGGLGELVELAMPLLVPGGRLIAWKRGDLTAEVAAARRAGDAIGAARPILHRAISPAAEAGGLQGLHGHVLVEIRKLRPTPPRYPRDPAARRRQPW